MTMRGRDPGRDLILLDIMLLRGYGREFAARVHF
jgi:hypothetical protein